MNGIFSCGWLWLYAGAILMFLELIAPGFVIFFFGLAAATVGLVRFALGDTFTLAGQLAAFSALSIVYIVLLRRWMKSIFSGRAVASAEDFDNGSVGRTGRVTVPIAPPDAGRVEIGDAEWTARADVPIAAGTLVKVISQNNLTMKVEVI